MNGLEVLHQAFVERLDLQHPGRVVLAGEVDAAALALKAGVDVDMVSRCYLRLPEALSRGRVADAALGADKLGNSNLDLTGGRS